jgi:cytochrome c peroxidase
MRNGLFILLFSLGGASAGVVVTGCNAGADDFFCGDYGCDLSAEEWRALSALADLPAAPPDPSNKYVGNSGAETLGHKLFYDTRFSGSSLQVDALRRPVLQGRAVKGQPSGLACISCHDPARGGIDTSSVPGHVSVGAGWADTNALPSFNAAHYTLPFWNGRADSLWAQAAAAVEGALMNGSRLQIAWVLQTFYRDEYNNLFGEFPLPTMASRAEIQALVETEGTRIGQCKLTPATPQPSCPVDKGCREVSDGAGGPTGCWPAFPLQGKPGSKTGCQPGDPAEPAGDAFDCLPKEDQDRVTKALVSFSKAVAAYEQKLVTGESAFDRWVHDVRAGQAAESRELSEPAKRGARLFVGKAACVDCHSTPFFSDNNFYNIGVAQIGTGVPTEADCPEGGVCDCSPAAGLGRNCLPWGARDGLAKLRRNPFRRDSVWSDDRNDRSRMRFVEMALEQMPRGTWRTPTLRNVALTAPYMHDGALATLDDVVQHYNRAGSAEAPGVPHARIKPLFLDEDERSALVAFMKALNSAPPPAQYLTPPTLP